jgi:hypothetical protein
MRSGPNDGVMTGLICLVGMHKIGLPVALADFRPWLPRLSTRLSLTSLMGRFIFGNIPYLSLVAICSHYTYYPSRAALTFLTPIQGWYA